MPLRPTSAFTSTAKTRLVSGLFIVIAILAYFVYQSSITADAPFVDAENPRVVTLASLKELSERVSSLSVLGVVSSVNQSNITAESQGRVTGVYASLGQTVKAGEILAELENSRERAQVLQAQGAYESAKAGYEKVSTSARSEQIDILALTSASAKQSFESSKESALNALLTAYGAIDDAISKKTDSNFNNPSSNNPVFIIGSGSSRDVLEATNRRVSLQSVLERNNLKAKNFTLDTDFLAEFAVTEKDLRDVRTYLDSVANALNQGVQSGEITATTIAGNKADAAVARASINAALSALSASKENLNVRKSSLAIAEKNLELGKAGGQNEDVLASRGALKSSEGTLLSAKANLEKSLFRAPITGTVNALNVKKGEFATPGTVIAILANNDALEIVAYVTDKERLYVSAGSTVTIDGSTPGIVTAVAPAIDTKTKKVEVRISIPSLEKSTLANGMTVRVSIPEPKILDAKPLIPISSLKITPDGTYVFGVSEDDITVAIPVIIGTLRGSSVELVTKLDSALKIIVDARGLKEGEKIEIK